MDQESSKHIDFSQKKDARRFAKDSWDRLLSEEGGLDPLYDQLFNYFNKFGTPGRILAYLPLSDEPDLWPCLRELSAPIYIPRVVDRTTMEFRLFYHGGSLGPAEPGFRGIPGAPENTPLLSGDLTGEDLILVPALASTPAGYRLGRGGGYYDRWREKIGKARALSLLPEKLTLLNFPVESHDLRLHSVITESGVVDY